MWGFNEWSSLSVKEAIKAMPHCQTVEMSWVGVSFKGRHQNSPQYDDKDMLGNIGDLFVKCM